MSEDLSMLGLLLRRVERSKIRNADPDPIVQSVGVQQIAATESPRCSRCGNLYIARPVGSKLSDSKRCRSCDAKLAEAATERKVLKFGGRP